MMERADGTFDSACLPPLTTAQTDVVNTNTDFKVDSLIWCHYSTNTEEFAGTTLTADSNYKTQVFSESDIIPFLFNGTAHLQQNSWVYIVGIPQADPMAFRLDPTSFTSWYTTTKPATDDGKVYIRLGYLSGSARFSLFAYHPAFWFKDGAFRPYLTRGAVSSTVTAAEALTPVALEDGTDLDTLINPGFYRAQNDVNARTMLNLPPQIASAAAFSLQVEQMNNSNGRIQTLKIVQMNPLRILCFIRARNSAGVWGDWAGEAG